jgi:uracil-DNA glycosylase
MSGSNERESIREDFADLAGSLRAYLEYHSECGTVGFPKGPKQVAPTLAASPSAASAPAQPQRPDALNSIRESERETAFEPPPFMASDLDPKPAPASVRPPKPAALSVEARLRRLEVLRAEVASCTRCALSASRTHAVYSRGNPEAQLCFVGEAPDAEEDAQGLPFVGPAGELLNKMIVAMGLDPERDVYICTSVKCKPTAGAQPSAEEAVSCMPYLEEQLELLSPKVIVALGNVAATALLGTVTSMTKLRGQWKLYRGKIAVMPTYHPSMLLKPGAGMAEAKKLAWLDLQAVMKELGLPQAPPKK